MQNEEEDGKDFLQWGRDIEEQGLVASLSDNWTPEEREWFLADWRGDE